ncbi:MAG TPA: CHAP domain-containing protein [Solirubrobacteraceae bacterium]|nr:CHAP domain-containing protein [Solirubrobacteraceae bacterium]
MSLDATLARIAALESAFVPASVRAATTTAAAPASSVTFASQLQGAMTPNLASSLATDASVGLASPVGPSAFAVPTGNGGASAMVRIAESQVGQAEQPPGSNDGPAIATYRSATAGATAGEPWCAYFASWVARQAGIPLGDSDQGFGYVGDIWNWARQTGRSIPNGPGVVPSPGDLIVFGDHHVGIVEQVLPNGSIETIEGNYSDQVSRVIRGADEATGYVRMG